MYRYFLLVIFLALVSPFANLAIKGQDTDMTFDPSNSYREKLVISTDRDIYITGERVYLKVVEIDDQGCIPAGLSKVVYLELLDISNNPADQAKVRIEGTSGSSVFRLSDTLSSGNYLIRAYSSWMQNFPEDLFSYNTITVINPFKDISDLTAPASNQIDDTTHVYIEGYEFTCNKEARGQFEITTRQDKEKYGKREKVKLNILIKGTDGNPVEADLSVSVVKSFLRDTGRKYLTENEENNIAMEYSSGYPVHLPELEGELIRGVIYNKTTYEPLKEADISLSFVGKTARCQFMRTNTKGEFTFVVKDLAGQEEIVIQPLNPGISGSYVEIDQPFCDTYNGFRAPELYLDSSMTETLNNAVISMQVNNIYEQARDEEDNRDAVGVADFFGKYDRRIKIEDYIELADIREVVKEILPEVVLFRKDKQPALKVLSSNPYQIFENQALVLFDGVPVYDIEKLLEVSSRELERIDIINSRYFYGDYIFEGIINFVSKKGDLSAIASDNFVFRQLFEGYREKINFHSPDYSADSARFSRIPDMRNTLYWNPAVSTSGNGSATVEFYTSDEEMEYMIIIDGFTSDGRRIYLTTPLIVN